MASLVNMVLTRLQAWNQRSMVSPTAGTQNESLGIVNIQIAQEDVSQYVNEQHIIPASVSNCGLAEINGMSGLAKDEPMEQNDNPKSLPKDGQPDDGGSAQKQRGGKNVDEDIGDVAISFHIDMIFVTMNELRLGGKTLGQCSGGFG
ncbi:hypothetical protein O6H91_10G085900 [Diphasiastrum complanatum]|uniref:Uncharacterized protein n=1 Tax=Diphasiastrum complanatum TaxID=34168 RepID=A0ACC2CJ89_DIPCM|nr:hypothetical protein O6H91_10G085900 [Diphasiastrum complanatum]